MNKLLIAMSVSFVGHLLAWFHMQGQFKYEWAKSLWWVILGGIPISIAFWYGTKWYYEYFGNYWYVRPIGFVMTWLILGEAPDTRTWICMLLSIVIIIIQLSHVLVE